ncbi:MULTISPECIES: hypothetical protein [Asticcacaulis]|uniref:hypothetical protein n=1 Tax=Asticcacaulis TaxID=76890 RepID=UPI001AE7AA94|nr:MULTISPECIES: hypothetical protein [Asticcacaulis]MBP2161636.1 hypothetical protein [Asticcacaulis solisilvae]MDR6802739.1 hypothetical protein [Asticcacaulis sp. BE141]
MNRLPLQRLPKHRRPIAIAVSLALHVLFAVALLPNTPSGFSTGGQGGAYQGEDEGLSLDLTAMALPEAQSLEIREPQPESVSELDALDDLTTLARTESFSAALPAMPAVEEMDAAETTAAKSALKSAAPEGGEGQGGTSSGALDDLWAAIAPCWRRIADTKTLPVNLTVTFAANGMLAKPPEIARKAEDASNPQALRSESLAITALAECGAYQMAAGRESVNIHFPKP